jgi:hypothetical protein
MLRIRMPGIVLMLAVIASAAPAQPPRLNFSHLRHLTETISLDGENVDIVHVYANAPDYTWQEAADAGPEGVACVDDAARAAVLYLRHYEITQSRQSLSHATALLRFVLKMQSADGQFFNFVRKDHSINTTGRTSIKSFGWWAARGLWALGTGYRVLQTADPAFAHTLKAAIDKALPHVNALLSRFGVTDTIAGYVVPRWLPYDSGADVTAELVLGLADYYAAAPDTALRSVIEKLAAGMMLMQNGTRSTPPYGVHRSWETRWHMWGNSQTQALATAGRVLGNGTLLASAEREGAGFYIRLLVDGFIKEWDLASADPPQRYEQIAYAIRPMAVGFIRLYEATGNERYLAMAGLAGSWLCGNNIVHLPMYDPATGRCFDGIRDSVTVNRNSGAESTIEALATLAEIERFPRAAAFLAFKRVTSGNDGRTSTVLFADDRGNQVTLAIDLASGESTLK